MKKEITVTLTGQSHCHAEMVIHKAENMSLIFFIKLGDQWEITGNHDNAVINLASHYEYFLCQPEYVNECLHWLNGGDVEFRVVGNDQWSDYPSFKEREWEHYMTFMREGLEFRIKKESEYINVISVFDLKRDEQYYCNSTGKSYDPIGQYPSEQYLVAQLENNNLYRKVEK